MKVDLKGKLFRILFENRDIKINKDTSNENVERYNFNQSNNKSLRRGFKYQRYENVRIDKSFKYCHFDLTGDVSKDFKFLFGSNDPHNSKKVLEHPFSDNLLKIKRSHDIILHKKDDVYNIYNGRHRLIYLNYYYNKLPITEGFEAPASVTKEFEDNETNEILETLINDFEATIHKYNYYDDEVALCIIINRNVYVVNNLEELKDFYKNIDKSNFCYHYTELTDILEIDFNKLFRFITEIVGDKLFEMNFLELLNFVKNNSIIIDNVKITVENMNITKFYHYYFDICHNVQYCKIHNYEIPQGIDVLRASHLPINRCGHMIMEFLYNNSQYQDLSWSELFEVIHTFPEFEEFDSDLLFRSAKKFGYVEGSGKCFKKKVTFFKR